MKMTRYLYSIILMVLTTYASAQPTAGGIINHYTEVLSFDSCKNVMLVQDAGMFQPGDTILIIQMKGAVIDSSNTAGFGEIIQYRSAGNYEFNYVSKKNGNEIILKNKLYQTYNIPDGIVQLVRVPYYKSDVTINSMLTAADWDGSKGGILVLNSGGNIRLNAAIDVSGKGFKGGIGGLNTGNISPTCNVTLFAGPYSAGTAQKGESIVSVSDNINYGRSAVASGGGGGLGNNSGGGGGGNAGTGGYGGYQAYTCTNGQFENRGLGGNALSSFNTQKVFLGGGGGAGDVNDDSGMMGGGGKGGGIAIIIGKNLTTNSYEINAAGADAPECLPNLQQNGCNEGMGGGGAGGSVLLNIEDFTDQATIDITGGKGANMNGQTSAKAGPGGGGSGGIVWFSDIIQPANAVVVQSGGAAGVNVNSNNDYWGATDGDPGRNYFELQLPFSNVPATSNIESIGFNETSQSCTQFAFDGYAQTTVTAITSWNWDFGDGTQQSGKQVTHTYANGGDYLVKLFVTDGFGCKDTTEKIIKPGVIQAHAGTDVTICGSTSFTLQGAGGTSYSWSPGSYLNDSTAATPVGSVDRTTTFTLLARSGICEDTALVTVTVQNPMQLVAPADISGCEGSSLQLRGNNGNNVLYEWFPATSFNDPNATDPIVIATENTTFRVTIKEPVCNTSKEFQVNMTVFPKPNVKAGKSNDIDCNHATATLMATGADQFAWSPSGNLNNPGIANPVATIANTTVFKVTGTTTAGCSATDSITLNKTAGGIANFTMPNAFTPNNDRINDCFGVERFGNIALQEFAIYNRWGTKVFSSTNPTQCWDGTFRGKLLESGGYGYVIRGNSECGPINLKGVVLLIR